eukprot:TRINITY_DN1967_c0_g1_i6.p3 TRINITY_DN1967_c0_g1~~TRINITY_DN1967_c0_g1_i6.p3  ORF type:complete len:126 (+),score=30.30 TRINITY_DN1967_c0_g1_i6:46-378(+)
MLRSLVGSEMCIRDSHNYIYPCVRVADPHLDQFVHDLGTLKPNRVQALPEIVYIERPRAHDRVMNMVVMAVMSGCHDSDARGRYDRAILGRGGEGSLGQQLARGEGEGWG